MKPFVMKSYKRGKIVFKIGLFAFLTIPPSIFYFKRNQKELYARGIIKDMKRIEQKGKNRQHAYNATSAAAKNPANIQPVAQYTYKYIQLTSFLKKTPQSAYQQPQTS